MTICSVLDHADRTVVGTYVHAMDGCVPSYFASGASEMIVL